MPFPSFSLLSLSFLRLFSLPFPSEGGSVVGEASTILAHSSPNFHKSQKVRNLASFKTSLNFEPHTFENAARYLNSETKMQCCDVRPMSLLSLVKLVHAPLRKLCQLCSPLKLHAKTCSSITQPLIIRFSSNLVQSLNTGHPKCCKSSRSKGQGHSVT